MNACAPGRRVGAISIIARLFLGSFGRLERVFARRGARFLAEDSCLGGLGPGVRCGLLVTNKGAGCRFFTQEAMRNKGALLKGIAPEGRVSPREGMVFPPRKLAGIKVVPVVPPATPAVEAA